MSSPIESGALVLGAAPTGPLPTPAAGTGARRQSAITRGTVLVHADLHNHTVLSDGAGDPEAAFESMRAAGLDVAALTDHATHGASVEGTGAGGMPWIGLDRAGWRRTGQLADAHDAPGEFTAIRGFEWSHPHLGHVNAWFTDDFTDIDTDPGMSELYEWLGAHPGIAGFNHPGRERGCFSGFAYRLALVDQVVGLEMFNRTEDYLFEGVRRGAASPLVACLEAGWRPGLLGVTDEHGTGWGFRQDKGRAGLWVTELSRAGVAEAMRSRRVFATRVPGLRVDATANGARMGATLRHTFGTVQFAVDVDAGPAWAGRALQVQVLRPDHPAPRVVELAEVRCGEVARFTVPLDLAVGGWMVLRIAEPEAPNDAPGPSGHPANNRAVAYTSPWYLAP